MKILHFITSLKTGGAESALVNFLTYTQCKGYGGTHHTVLHLYHGPNVEKIENLGIQTYQLKGLLHHYDPAAFFRLLKFIKKIKPDIIHTALWSANIMGRLAGKILGIPVLSDLHGSAIDEGSFRNFFDALTAPCASKIIAVSPSVQAAYQQAVIPKIVPGKLKQNTSSKLKVINNGIDVEQVQAQAQTNPLTRADFSWTEHDFIIGAVGRLEPIKSYDLLIRAFALLYAEMFNTGSRLEGRDDNSHLDTKLQGASHKQPKLCLVGDGSQMQSLQNLAKELGVFNHVTFVGARNDAIKFYPLFDCFALSSRSEGLSIALLEALCFGLPIVTTHHNMQHDVITHEVNGLLVPVGDEQALADALKKLLLNADITNTMRLSNMQLIKRFDLSHTARAYARAYQDAA